MDCASSTALSISASVNPKGGKVGANSPTELDKNGSHIYCTYPCSSRKFFSGPWDCPAHVGCSGTSLQVRSTGDEETCKL